MRFKLGTSRSDYEYEIEYEYELLNLFARLRFSPVPVVLNRFFSSEGDSS